MLLKRKRTTVLPIRLTRIETAACSRNTSTNINLLIYSKAVNSYVNKVRDTYSADCIAKWKRHGARACSYLAPTNIFSLAYANVLY